LEGVVRAFSLQMSMGHGAEFFVDEWEERLQSLLISGLPLYK
jgi:hypothetical protein